MNAIVNYYFLNNKTCVLLDFITMPNKIFICIPRTESILCRSVRYSKKWSIGAFWKPLDYKTNTKSEIPKEIINRRHNSIVRYKNTKCFIKHHLIAALFNIQIIYDIAWKYQILRSCRTLYIQFLYDPELSVITNCCKSAKITKYVWHKLDTLEALEI